MSISLTIKDRYELIKYTHKLPCTLRLRQAVDGFFDQIELSEAEKEKYDIKVDPLTYEVSSNDETYEVLYETFPEPVIKAISGFVRDYDNEEGQKSPLVKSALSVFKKVL